MTSGGSEERVVRAGIPGAAWKMVTVIERLSKLSGVMAAILLAAITALMLTEIIWRLAIAKSLHFTWEYSAYAMAGVFLLGASYTLACGTHVRVTALLETTPTAISRWLDWTCTLIGFLVATFVAFALFGLAITSWKSGIVSFTINRVPLTYPQFIMAAGALLLMLQFLARLIRLTIGEAAETVPDDDKLPTEED